MWKRVNPFPHTTILQQTTLNVFCQNIENLYIIEWITYDKKWKTLWQKEKLHVLCNFFFCHYVFKKPSAAEASESVYMWKRVKYHNQISILPYSSSIVQKLICVFQDSMTENDGSMKQDI